MVISPRIKVAINLLAAGKTSKYVSEHMKIQLKTVQRWFSDPKFREELEKKTVGRTQSIVFEVNQALLKELPSIVENLSTLTKSPDNNMSLKATQEISKLLDIQKKLAKVNEKEEDDDIPNF